MLKLSTAKNSRLGSHCCCQPTGVYASLSTQGDVEPLRPRDVESRAVLSSRHALVIHPCDVDHSRTTTTTNDDDDDDNFLLLLLPFQFLFLYLFLGIKSLGLLNFQPTNHIRLLLFAIVPAQG